ncbi:ABC transporter permease [Geodermatophilus sp. DF01-2]|uniref:ABC transporter permease n=1 Tax=Geodermatophilus sp. DF01-2 TaxID=2559610 RepID=UPI0014309285|nr:ABC transporter permease [Geodermatophilus sp. DF01_2]
MTPQLLPGQAPQRLADGTLERVAALPGVTSVTYVVETNATVTTSLVDTRVQRVLVAGVSFMGNPRISEVVTGERRAVQGLPFAVVGRVAAQVLGVDSLPAVIYVSGQAVRVTGIAGDDPLFPHLTDAVMVDPTFALRLDSAGAAETLGIRAEGVLTNDLIRRVVDPFDATTLVVERPPGLVEAREKSGGVLSGLALVGSVTAFGAALIGVGVTMTAAVRQRSSELALRRVHGASQFAIIKLIVAEAVLLGLVGGGLGVGLGTGTFRIVCLVNDWPFLFNGGLALAGIGLSLTTCLFASLVPAVVAVRMEPTRALAVE